MSLRGEAGAQLGRGNTTLGHGDHGPGALVVAGFFQGVGHGAWRLGGAHRWQGRARRLSSNQAGQTMAPVVPWVHDEGVQGSSGASDS